MRLMMMALLQGSATLFVSDAMIVMPNWALGAMPLHSAVVVAESNWQDCDAKPQSLFSSSMNMQGIFQINKPTNKQNTLEQINSSGHFKSMSVPPIPTKRNARSEEQLITLLRREGRGRTLRRGEQSEGALVDQIEHLFRIQGQAACARPPHGVEGRALGSGDQSHALGGVPPSPG